MFKKKITKFSRFEEKLIIVILFSLGFYLLITSFMKTNLKIAPTFSMDDYVYEGDVFYTYIFNNNIGHKVYLNNNEYESYFINLETGEQSDMYSLVNKNKIEIFNEKIKELLLLKYPGKIVDILLESKINYIFKDNLLQLNFYEYEEKIPTKKAFSLQVNYAEIKDYLLFKPKIDSSYLNESGFTYDKDKITIVLSFDDGPNGARTKEIIDTLEDYKMSASFFIVGNKIANNEDSVKYVYNSHSEIGYHSFSHTRMTTQSEKTLKEELLASDNLYHEITGDHFKIVRPPYGSYNTKVLNIINMPIIRWNIDTNDWQYKDVNHIVNEVLTKYKDGSIILCHDSYDTTVKATKEFLYKLYLEDVQVLSVSEYAKLRDIKLENQSVYYNF